MNALLDFPDDARLWVYAFDRELTPADAARARDILDAFMAQWNSHGEPVAGAWTFVENWFLLIAGHCPAGIGGCATDSSVHAVKAFCEATGVNAFDRDLVFYRDGDDRVQAAGRGAFQGLVDSGAVTGETMVFDPTITTVGDARSGRLERPMRECWHARAFATTG